MRRRESSAPPRLRGRVEDRPWGLVLAGFAREGRSGQLVLHAPDGKVYTIALAHGLVVGALSPIAADRVARIAVGDRLVTPARIGELARVSPSVRRDELDGFVAAADLPPEQVLRLKHRVLVQRAARTFALERGAWDLDDKISIPVLLGATVDLPAVIYHGARLNLDGARLAADVRGMGARFQLAADAPLARFELGDAEATIVDGLRAGTSVAELEARHRELDPRMVQAVIYALAACGAIVELDAPFDAAGTPSLPRAPTPRDEAGHAPSLPRAPTPRDEPGDLSLSRVPTPRAPTLSCVPMLIRSDPVFSTQHRSAMPRGPAESDLAITRVPTPRAPEATRVPTPREPMVTRVPTPREPDASRAPGTPPIAAGSPRVFPRASTPAPVTRRPPRFPTLPAFEARATSVRPNALSAREVRELIARGSQRLDEGADHFTLLGLPIGAPVDTVRTAYLELARYLQPDRLAALGIRDTGFRARALFAQACIAHTVLTDPALRARYVARLRDLRVPAAVGLDFAQVAAEAFARGEQALRADDPELAVAELRTACELAPDDLEYLATLGRAELGVRARARRGDQR